MKALRRFFLPLVLSSLAGAAILVPWATSQAGPPATAQPPATASSAARTAGAAPSATSAQSAPAAQPAEPWPTQGVDLPEPLVSVAEVQKEIANRVTRLNDFMDAKRFWEVDIDKDVAPARRNIERVDFWGGRTALAALALLYAGEDPKSERMQKVLKFLAEIDMKGTYAVAIRTSFLAKLKDPKVKPLLLRDARTLMLSLVGKRGYFGYEPGQGGDHSNTQYGVLGLRDASVRGVEVPPQCWENIQQHMLDSQHFNGGWGYDVVRKPTIEAGVSQIYCSMTLAGLANLYITIDRLQSAYEGPFNGTSARGCGSRRQPEAIDKALAWMDRNLPVDFGLQQGGDPYGHSLDAYTLYTLERCADASGRKNFGGVNWFQGGAKWFLTNPRARNNDPCEIAWGLLFLAKGQGAVFYNKLDTHADWNNDLLDIPNLSNYIGEELEQKVNWQVIDMHDKVEEWLDAPILFFNGHTFPKFTDEEKKKLRLYTDSGGTLVAEACCGSSEFATGFKKLAREVWPEWELKMVERTHPVMTFHHLIKDHTPKMMHLYDGCRSRVFLVLEDMSCAWNQNAVDRYPGYFQLGLNLARYASDKRALHSRIYYRPPVCRELTEQGKPCPQAPGAAVQMTIADWPAEGKRLTNIRGLRHLAETLKDAANVELEVVSFNDQNLDGLDKVRVVHLSGHQGFSVSEENLAKLRAFIKAGGLIWADPECGREDFKASFQNFLAKLLPEAKLQKVIGEDPLLTGQGLERSGFDVKRVTYKQALLMKETAPVLQEVKVDGRRAIIYSLYDLTCGLDGQDTANCLGPERNDALKIASNIVLSALPADAPAAPANTAAAPASSAAAAPTKSLSE